MGLCGELHLEDCGLYIFICTVVVGVRGLALSLELELPLSVWSTDRGVLVRIVKVVVMSGLVLRRTGRRLLHQSHNPRMRILPVLRQSPVQNADHTRRDALYFPS